MNNKEVDKKITIITITIYIINIVIILGMIILKKPKLLDGERLDYNQLYYNWNILVCMGINVLVLVCFLMKSLKKQVKLIVCIVGIFIMFVLPSYNFTMQETIGTDGDIRPHGISEFRWIYYRYDCTVNCYGIELNKYNEGQHYGPW